MVRRLALIASLVVVFFLQPAIPVEARSSQPPNSMAALGDSITRAFNACGWFVDCPSRSWSTGDNADVESHYLRILSENPEIKENNFNDARSGAKVADLAGQAQTAVDQGVEYVTVLIGANDACTSSESNMTPVETFSSQLGEGLGIIEEGLPDARVFIASIPDIKRLWEVGKDNAAAREIWRLGGICQSMLANPTSDDADDQARRDRVRQRVIDYNAELAEACSAYGPNCSYDGGAVFEYPFTLQHVSEWDYFHPNTAGQRVLAEVTYEAGFNW
ncbi:MAG: SGNH/GDSL hydrolase family protein [Streptosporangiales bacterium]|nr:SGNH/GDSL hydrolase family protein [Streptosporangiales bacterium]